MKSSSSGPPSAMLVASRASVQLFIARGSSDVSIRELAAHVGISERTFYRYFPRKEDVVRPFLENGLQRIVDGFAARSASEPIMDSLAAAWADAWPLKEPGASAVFFRILEQHDSYRAARLQAIIDSEALWAEAIATRLGLAPSSPQALVAGAAIVTAFRMAWQSFSLDPTLDPLATLIRNFHFFSALLATPAEAADTGHFNHITQKTGNQHVR
ncbi:TetR/AcrR family transcriptional regulator [Massilia putida]|uniref:TetR/AcrR family transcriptional regulator n=1 Tax=Massilia putida TaxID=1141883 RepID=UPI0009FA53B4|nr:TetR/AcrR family transcriptional regulator [Massilia putida]